MSAEIPNNNTEFSSNTLRQNPLLENYGIQTTIKPEGSTINISNNGFEGYMNVGLQEETRIITNHNILQMITGNSNSFEPLLATIGPNGQVNISTLYNHSLDSTSDQSKEIKKVPLKSMIRAQGRTDDQIEIAKGLISKEKIVVERQDDPLKQIIESSNPDLNIFLQKILEIRIEKKGNDSDRQALSKYIDETKTRVLIEVSLTRQNNIPFDLVAQTNLPVFRLKTESLKEEQVIFELQQRYSNDPGYYKKLMDSDVRTQKEALAWIITLENTKTSLIADSEQDATLSELETAYSKINTPPTIYNEKAVVNKDTSVVDQNGDRIPSEKVFVSGEISPFTIDQFCELPKKPVVLPVGKPEQGTKGLATFLFDEILYSPLVCDRRGTQVGLSQEKRQEYLDKIEHAIKNDIPIIATEYVPYNAVANPLKRNTQSIALAEIDYLVRHAEISTAVEMYYKPGLIWYMGNEAPAFQGPMFNLPENYVAQFHKDANYIMQKIDPDGRKLKLFNMADALWGTEERKTQWEEYQKERIGFLREAFDDPNHPSNPDIRTYINTFIYPMSTCINPFKLEGADKLSMTEIMQMYARLKVATGTQFKGVDTSCETWSSEPKLSPDQQKLFNHLYDWGKELSFLYRAAMDAREDLPAFKEYVPDHAIGYTIITKRDKLVLLPNSGKSAFFPAHGEPVLQPARNPNQRTTVTIRPWWQIAAQPERYKPMYTKDRVEPLYFKET